MFGLKAQHDAFVGLDGHHQPGRLPIESGLGRKGLMRHPAKLDGNFRGLPGEGIGTIRSTMISRWSSPIPAMIVWFVSLSVETRKIGSSCMSFASAMPIFSWSAFVFGS